MAHPTNRFIAVSHSANHALALGATAPEPAGGSAGLAGGQGGPRAPLVTAGFGCLSGRHRCYDRIRALVGTPVPAVTRTGPSPGTWLTDVPRTWRTASAIPFMPWM
jgi:hypothetical protein